MTQITDADISVLLTTKRKHPLF